VIHVEWPTSVPITAAVLSTVYLTLYHTFLIKEVCQSQPVC